MGKRYTIKDMQLLIKLWTHGHSFKDTAFELGRGVRAVERKLYKLGMNDKHREPTTVALSILSQNPDDDYPSAKNNHLARRHTSGKSQENYFNLRT